ncbi:MAG: photosynthetic complex assembly protein PuhC [Pseudomonadota bacterium]
MFSKEPRRVSSKLTADGRPKVMPLPFAIALVALMGVPLVVVFLSPDRQARIAARQEAAASQSPLEIALSAPVAERRALLFTDEPDGGVRVRDEADGATIRIFEAGSAGFVRTAMRGLAHSRMKIGVGPETPFILGATEDGRCVLFDPTTNHLVELAAFGERNARFFTELMHAPALERNASL